MIIYLTYLLNHNSNISELSTKDNKLKKNIIISNNNNNKTSIFYIPNFNYGLFNGGILDLTYLGNNFNNNPQNINEIGSWIINGNLIGNISIPRNFKNINILKLYINLSSNNLEFITSFDGIYSYFNNTLFDLQYYL